MNKSDERETVPDRESQQAAAREGVEEREKQVREINRPNLQ